jgi:hypothetical protein
VSENEHFELGRWYESSSRHEIMKSRTSEEYLAGPKVVHTMDNMLVMRRERGGVEMMPSTPPSASGNDD